MTQRAPSLARLAVLFAAVIAAPGASLAADAGTPTPPEDITVPAAPEFPIPYGEGMTAPRLLSKDVPTYNAEALQKKVEGQLLVKCKVTLEGRARECRTVKTLMFPEAQLEASRLSADALQFLGRARFEPGQYQGKPQAMVYLFDLRFRPPAHPDDPAFVVAER